MAGLNDGYDPASSNDKSHGVWHNWLGDNGADAWVQYDWESEVTIYQSDAYYFTDGNFVPKSVSYQYKDANGNWRDLPNVSGCGTELNKYNTTTFAPVTTTAIRMNMSPKTQGCGVIEWKVYGYAENVIDKTLLKKTIDSANALDLTKYELTEEDKAALTEAIQEAVTVNDNKEATQEEVDFAAAKLARIMSSLPTADGNLAYGAAVSTSYVSSWEKVSAVNDGKIPESSYNPSGMARYGTWGNASSKETVTYTWNQEMKLTGADIYLWYDGDTEGDYTKGGIKIPKSYTYEYLDSEGNWKEVPNPSSYGMEALKAQAVCARSYAYIQMMHNKYEAYGAHVDDSVNFQVYNKQNQTPETVAAVDETKGQVLSYKGDIIETYYYSTSYGHTGDYEAWNLDKDAYGYLQGVWVRSEENPIDLSDEKSFLDYISNVDSACYESDLKYFRWNTVLDFQGKDETLLHTIADRKEHQPEAISYYKDTSKTETTDSCSNFGSLQAINVVKRNQSGVILELELDFQDRKSVV